MLLKSAVSANERARIIVCGSAVLFDFLTLLILMTKGDCSKVSCSEVPEPLKLISTTEVEFLVFKEIIEILPLEFICGSVSLSVFSQSPLTHRRACR